MNDRKIIGIDFGTTTTLVSSCQGTTKILNIAHNGQILETVMKLSNPIDTVDIATDSFENVVESYGDEAWKLRKGCKDRTYFNFKPQIGEDENTNKLAELWLKIIFNKITQRLNGADLSEYNFVIGVPAKWDDERIRRYQNIATKVGLRMLILSRSR